VIVSFAMLPFLATATLRRRLGSSSPFVATMDGVAADIELELVASDGPSLARG